MRSEFYLIFPLQLKKTFVILKSDSETGNLKT